MRASQVSRENLALIRLEQRYNALQAAVSVGILPDSLAVRQTMDEIQAMLSESRDMVNG